MNPLLVGLTFQAPERGWLLVPVVAVVVGYVVVQQRRPKVAARFTNLELLESVVPRGRDWKRHVGSICFALGLVALVGALAQPHTERRVPSDRGTVVLAIDVSLSMDATDVSPNRIRAAQEAALSFLSSVPDRFNVGIVAFHGAASVLVPPTTDRESARAAVEGLRLGESTAIGEGIFASLAAIDTVPPADDGSPVPARIVLMSDGATQTGRSNAQAVAAAREAQVPVDTIAFGTDHGTVTIPGYEGEVDVDVDRTALEKIARDSGGRAYTAATEAEIREVYEQIGSSVGYRTRPVDISAWFVVGAFILGLAAAAASLVWSERML